MYTFVNNIYLYKDKLLTLNFHFRTIPDNRVQCKNYDCNTDKG